MVFISYSTKNENIANKINNTLKQSGFKTWFTRRKCSCWTKLCKRYCKCNSIVKLFTVTLFY